MGERGPGPGQPPVHSSARFQVGHETTDAPKLKKTHSELKVFVTSCLRLRVLVEKGKEVMFVRPKKLIRTSGAEALGYVDIRTLAEGMCRYDLNEEDVAWLQIINEEFAEMGEFLMTPNADSAFLY